jgi:hypothetical protein
MRVKHAGGRALVSQERMDGRAKQLDKAVQRSKLVPCAISGQDFLRNLYRSWSSSPYYWALCDNLVVSLVNSQADLVHVHDGDQLSWFTYHLVIIFSGRPVQFTPA